MRPAWVSSRGRLQRSSKIHPRRRSTSCTCWLVHYSQGKRRFGRSRSRTTVLKAAYRRLTLMSENSVSTGLPPAQGLYDPRGEHDACGIGFVANIKGQKSHDIIVKGIQVLINLTHRGACGCD